MFFKKSNQAMSYAETVSLIEKAMMSFAETIKTISSEGMYSFFEEAISQDKSAKSVESEALKKACVIYNYIFVKDKMDEHLSESVKPHVGLLKKHLNLDLSDESKYLNDLHFAKRKLKEPGGGLEYSLLISNMFFNIYDDLVTKRTNKTGTSYVEKVCENCGLDKIHNLALAMPVNQALTGSILEMEQMALSTAININQLVGWK